MEDRQTTIGKQRYLRSLKTAGSLRLKFHDVDVSYVEAVFSRGDRRLHQALLAARERGMRMDAWGECFDIRKWEEVFQDAGFDPDWYALRERATDEIFPWDMIGLKIPRTHLEKEKSRAHASG